MSHAPHVRLCRRTAGAGSACRAGAVGSTIAQSWGTVTTRRTLLAHCAMPQACAKHARVCQDGCGSQLPWEIVEPRCGAAFGAPKRARTTAKRWKDSRSVRGPLEPTDVYTIAVSTPPRHSQYLCWHSRSGLQEPQNHAWHGSILSVAVAWHDIRKYVTSISSSWEALILIKFDLQQLIDVAAAGGWPGARSSGSPCHRQRSVLLLICAGCPSEELTAGGGRFINQPWYVAEDQPRLPLVR